MHRTLSMQCILHKEPQVHDHESSNFAARLSGMIGKLKYIAGKSVKATEIDKKDCIYAKHIHLLHVDMYICTHALLAHINPMRLYFMYARMQLWRSPNTNSSPTRRPELIF